MVPTEEGKIAVKKSIVRIDIPEGGELETIDSLITHDGEYEISTLMQDSEENDGITKNSVIEVRVPNKNETLVNKKIQSNSIVLVSNLMTDSINKDGISKESTLDVDVQPNLQSKTITLPKSNTSTSQLTTISPDSGYDGLSGVNIYALTSDITQDVTISTSTTLNYGNFWAYGSIGYVLPSSGSISSLQSLFMCEILQNNVNNSLGFNSVVFQGKIQNMDINSNGTYTPYDDSTIIRNITVNVQPNLYTGYDSNNPLVISSNSGTITIPSGYDGLGQIIYNTNIVSNLQSKSITLSNKASTTQTTTISPDSGYDGLSSVDVTVYTVDLSIPVSFSTSNSNHFEPYYTYGSIGYTLPSSGSISSLQDLFKCNSRYNTNRLGFNSVIFQGKIQNMNITSNGTYTPYDDSTIIRNITVNVPTSTISVQSSRSYSVTDNGSYTISPSSGYDAMSEVSLTVNVGSTVDKFVMASFGFGSSSKYTIQNFTKKYSGDISIPANSHFIAFYRPSSGYTRLYIRRTVSNSSSFSVLYTTWYYIYSSSSALEYYIYDASNNILFKKPSIGETYFNFDINSRVAYIITSIINIIFKSTTTRINIIPCCIQN